MLCFSSVAQPNTVKVMGVHMAHECSGYIGSRPFCLQGLHSCSLCSFLLDNSQKQIYVPCFKLNFILLPFSYEEPNEVLCTNVVVL